jgi:hypothetical protein
MNNDYEQSRAVQYTPDFDRDFRNSILLNKILSDIKLKVQDKNRDHVAVFKSAASVDSLNLAINQFVVDSMILQVAYIYNLTEFAKIKNMTQVELFRHEDTRPLLQGFREQSGFHFLQERSKHLEALCQSNEDMYDLRRFFYKKNQFDSAIVTPNEAGILFFDNLNHQKTEISLMDLFNQGAFFLGSLNVNDVLLDYPYDIDNSGLVYDLYDQCSVLFFDESQLMNWGRVRKYISEISDISIMIPNSPQKSDSLKFYAHALYPIYLIADFMQRMIGAQDCKDGIDLNSRNSEVYRVADLMNKMMHSL